MTRAALSWCAALCAIAALAILACTAFADEPTAEFHLTGGGRPHVDIPFELDLVVENFDEAPAPEQPPLTIPDADITPLGATPNVSRSIQIFNGRRRELTQVTWVLRWRVEVHKEGRLLVPETTVVQGAKRATATGGAVDVDRVPVADDMEIQLALPTRPVFVGESIPVTLTWLFKRQPQDQTFAVPLMSSDAFVVSAPTGDAGRRVITISGGAKDLQLPYTVDKVETPRGTFSRMTTTFFAAPRRAGQVDVEPASVVASLAVGRPDFFGDAATRLFRATDQPRTLQVRTLPESGRPPTFAGAVGGQFSISVRTSRSVVQLGEPVELEIAVRSDQPLDALSLGRLSGEGRLPKDTFTAPAESPTGELSDDGHTKTFKVVAQVVGPATEIPALAFSYFDPAQGAYRTIHSDPIALSVRGGSFVGAADVESAQPVPSGATATPTARSNAGGPAFTDNGALVGADLALSTPDAADDAPLSGALLWTLFGLLHAVPLAVFGAVSWRHRTQSLREEKAEIRAARGRVEELVAAAATQPARDVAGPLGAALRELARVLGRDVADGGLADGGLLSRIETESYAPSAASQPLPVTVREGAAALTRRWLEEARAAGASAPSGGSPSTRATSVVAALLLSLAASSALAAPDADGRSAYQTAMATTADASGRRAAFAHAEALLGDAVRATPDRPELLADWGNAALGAGDVATATLAYRRALAIDGENPRARHNLTWLRSRQADVFRPAGGGATDALLFFHAWPRSRRLLVGAAAFALATLLLVPWAGRRRRALRGLAVIPAALWLGMVASVVVEDRGAQDAVVMDDVVLRAADSPGAPAALSQPLPRGVEVAVLESRDTWTRIQIASGTSGWVPAGALQRVTP